MRGFSQRGTPRTWLAALALGPLLSGCVAAVAIPLVAGGALSARQHSVRVRAATPTKLDTAAFDPAPPGAAPLASAPATGVVLTELTELPPPSEPVASARDAWEPFFAYALEQAELARSAEQPQSALLKPGGSLLSPERRPCTARYPAVIVDLDKAGEAFSPARRAAAPPGLAQDLARLREAGIVVLWLSQLPASRAAEVAGALRSSGLDPESKDQLLLIRGTDDRKQALREEANLDVCVIALAGDERTDFDELFDYLRDPALGAGLDVMLGEGWFLVPQALAAPTP